MGLLGLGGAALALSLRPSAATDTFVGRSSTGYRATQSYYRSFGEEPVNVLVKGNLEDMLLSADIDRLLGLEGCLAGKVPAAGLPHEGGSNGPCAQLDRLGTVKVVIGPGTFVNEAVEQIDGLLTTQGNQAEREASQNEHAVRRVALAQGRSAAEANTLAEEAGKITRERYAQQLELLGSEYGVSAPPHAQRPELRLHARVRQHREAAGHPQAALRLPLPRPRSGADLGAHEGRFERSAAHAHNRRDPPRAGNATVAPAAR